MTYRLEKSSRSNRALTKFDVIDSAGAICGSINVPPSEEPALLPCWRTPVAKSSKQLAEERSGSKAAMVSAISKGRE